VLAGEITIAFQNYPLYADNRDSHTLLLEAQEAGNQFAGIIITNTFSNIEKIEQVKGKTILFTGRYGVGAFSSPLAALQAAGIGEEAVQLQSVAGNANENVVIGVSVGDADVGFVRDRAVLAACARYIQPNSVRVLAEGVTMPSPLLISVSKTLPDALKAEIKQAFLAANNQPELLKILGIRGFAELGETAAYWSKTLNFPLP
jgi:ABC-type phosphate/phosphonate transport system substrate-binding protein